MTPQPPPPPPPPKNPQTLHPSIPQEERSLLAQRRELEAALQQKQAEASGMAAELAASLASTARLEEAKREAADARQQAEAARARAMELETNWASSKLVRLRGLLPLGGSVGWLNWSAAGFDCLHACRRAAASAPLAGTS